MAHDCRNFRRETWPTLDERSRAEQLAECDDCARWSESWSRRAEALRSLEAREAPAELDALVAEAVGSSSPRLAAHLSGLPRVDAPEELEARIEVEVLGSRSAPFLHTLDYHEAPSVLDRLVNEELAAGAAATARRFAGDLEPVDAPPALKTWARSWWLRSAAEEERRGPGLRTWVGLATAAAAAWMLLPMFRSEQSPASPRNFRVVYVESPEALSPMARAIADGLSGAATLDGGGR